MFLDRKSLHLINKYGNGSRFRIQNESRERRRGTNQIHRGSSTRRRLKRMETLIPAQVYSSPVYRSENPAKILRNPTTNPRSKKAARSLLIKHTTGEVATKRMENARNNYLNVIRRLLI